MAELKWEINQVAYQPSTILYAERLNETFNTTLKVVQGIVEALGFYYQYEDTDISIKNNTSVEIIEESIKECLNNLFLSENENNKDTISINRTSGGITLTHTQKSSGGNNNHILSFSNDGIKAESSKNFEINLTGSTNEIILKNNYSGSSGNILKLGKTANDLTLNGQQIVYSLSTDDTYDKIIHKIYYNEQYKTIYFE